MSNEVSKVPGLPSVSQVMRHVAPPRTQNRSRHTPVGRFLKKVSDFFTTNSILCNHKLFGRISELQKTTEHTLHDLKGVKKSIEMRAHPSLFLLMCTVVDPIVKEMTRMSKTFENGASSPQQVKTVSRCVDCIEKARVWIDLVAGPWDEEKVRKVIIQQTVEEFQTRIDRDVQVVQDYLNHAIQDLHRTEMVKEQMRDRLMPMLSPILHKLYGLREVQGDLTIDNLTAWRSVADAQREGLFSATLHTIDTFFTEIH